jgi:hypothetical protein
VTEVDELCAAGGLIERIAVLVPSVAEILLFSVAVTDETDEDRPATFRAVNVRLPFDCRWEVGTR